MNETGIECRGICAGYTGRRVLHEVSAAFPKGKLSVLIGPNGSGKSTLLKTLAGLLVPESGKILLNGNNLSEYTPSERAKCVALLPQMRPTPELTAYQTVLAGRFPHLAWPRRYRPEDEAAAWKALWRTGAEGFAERPVRELSGGERQKVYLAAALCQDTEILLLDEPCSALDAGAVLDLMELLHTLCREGKTVIISLHDLPTAFSEADTLYVLESGRMTGFGSPDDAVVPAQKAFGVKLVRVGDGETQGILVKRT